MSSLRTVERGEWRHPAGWQMAPNRPTGGHVFALCHNNEGEPPRANTKLDYIKNILGWQCSPTHISMQSTQALPIKCATFNLEMGAYGSERAPPQKAEAKCQGRGMLLTKLQAQQTSESESQLFICSNLWLMIMLPSAVPWGPLSPRCNWQKTIKRRRAGSMIDRCRHVVPLPCVLGAGCCCDCCIVFKGWPASLAGQAKLNSTMMDVWAYGQVDITTHILLLYKFYSFPYRYKTFPPKEDIRLWLWIMRPIIFADYTLKHSLQHTE